MRALWLACLLAGCSPVADGVAGQAVSAAHAGDLLVYGSLDGGWKRAVLRGSVCAEERAMRAKGWGFDAGLQECTGTSKDGGAE